MAGGCTEGGGGPLDIALVAQSDDGPIEITTTIDGETTTTTDSGGAFRRELMVEGGFSVEIVATSGDDSNVECAIVGLDEPRDVELNPSLGEGDSVSLSGEPRVEGAGGVRCYASGSVDGGSVDYRSETEILG
jgi:hypothetical protein